MATKKETLSFEEALKGLETAARAIKSEETTLEDAIKSFEEGVEYYGKCREILEGAKQKIQLYDKTSGTLTPFGEAGLEEEE
ncbi:MAG: exodeoxyribonuclease VII small subunit [Bacillota bacterium]|nr:exodeoxyribonuclease VII small subunit [Bacillota bacterium]